MVTRELSTPIHILSAFCKLEVSHHCIIGLVLQALKAPYPDDFLGGVESKAPIAAYESDDTINLTIFIPAACKSILSNEMTKVKTYWIG